MEGTLEFLCGLPVEPGAIAASRLVAMALFSIPWAVGVGLLAFGLPPIITLSPLALALLAWLLFVLLGACGIAVLARFDLESLLGAPLVAMVLFFVLAPRVARSLAPGLTTKVLLGYAQRPYAPAGIALALIAAIAVTGCAAFAVTTQAIAGYRRDTTRA